MPNFLFVEAPPLQAVARRSGRNWVTPVWETEVFLKRREPLLLSSSMCGVDLIELPTRCTQARRAAHIIYVSVNRNWLCPSSRCRLLQLAVLQMLSIGDRSIRVSTNGYECARCLTRLFAATRVPGSEVDEWRQMDGGYSKHVVVHAAGHFYTIDCFDVRTDRLRTVDELTELIKF